MRMIDRPRAEVNSQSGGCRTLLDQLVVPSPQRLQRDSGAHPPGEAKDAATPKARIRALVGATPPVKLEPMVNDVVAELPRDLLLQLFDPVGAEFDDIAGVDVDEMVVMVAAGLLET